MMGASTLGMQNMSVDIVNKEDTRCAEPRNMTPYNCSQCSDRHVAWQCLMYGKNCAKCKGRNLFAKMCFWEDKTEGRKTVHAIEREEALFTGMVQNESKQVRDEADEVHSRTTE